MIVQLTPDPNTRHRLGKFRQLPQKSSTFNFKASVCPVSLTETSHFANFALPHLFPCELDTTMELLRRYTSSSSVRASETFLIHGPNWPWSSAVHGIDGTSTDTWRQQAHCGACSLKTAKYPSARWLQTGTIACRHCLCCLANTHRLPDV